MVQRTCSMPECGKRHRARGLCSTHYNQQLATPEQRHRKVTVPCTWCKVDCPKYPDQGSKYSELFCSLTCRDSKRAARAHARAERERDRLLPVGPVPRTLCALPSWHPARRIVTGSRVWTAGDCTECGASFVTNLASTRFCSPRCSKRHHRRKRKVLHGYIIATSARAYVFTRDRWTCWLCHQPILRDLKAPHPLSPSIDHVLPQSRGGGHQIWNLRAAHFLCNSLRGNRSPAVMRTSAP